jgi:hypothetical protein
MTAAAQKHQDDQKPTLKSPPGPGNTPLAWTLSTKPWELLSRPSEGFSWEKDSKSCVLFLFLLESGL